MPPLMTHPAKQKDRLQMIELALKVKAPATYLTLKRSGDLDRFVRQRESAMMESYDLEEEALTFKWAQKEGRDHLTHLQDFETMTRELWEQTLSTWLEFADTYSTNEEAWRVQRHALLKKKAQEALAALRRLKKQHDPN